MVPGRWSVDWQEWKVFHDKGRPLGTSLYQERVGLSCLLPFDCPGSSLCRPAAPSCPPTPSHLAVQLCRSRARCLAWDPLAGSLSGSVESCRTQPELEFAKEKTISRDLAGEEKVEEEWNIINHRLFLSAIEQVLNLNPKSGAIVRSKCVAVSGDDCSQLIKNYPWNPEGDSMEGAKKSLYNFSSLRLPLQEQDRWWVVQVFFSVFFCNREWIHK